jgi:hypothetical protein
MIRPSGITAVSAITAVFMLPYLNKEQTLNAWLTSKLIDTYDSLPHSGGARCAIIPPIVALAPGSTGKNSPVSRRATLTCSRVTPACTRQVEFSRSIYPP